MSTQKIKELRKQLGELTNVELVEMDAEWCRGGLPRLQYRVEILPDDTLSIEWQPPPQLRRVERGVKPSAF
jgi:hypothetical protein